MLDLQMQYYKYISEEKTIKSICFIDHNVTNNEKGLPTVATTAEIKFPVSVVQGIVLIHGGKKTKYRSNGSN